MNNKTINETHLGYIQETISRMSKNSFQAKAWCITITSAIAALFIQQESTSKNYMIMAIAIFAVILFYFLDTYYLYLEKGYRKLYKRVAGIITDVKVPEFSMEREKADKGLCTFLSAMISASTILFYGSIVIVLSLIIVFLK